MIQKKSFFIVALIISYFTLCFLSQGFCCSTYLLHKGNTFLIGHNLDWPFKVPGMIVINKRNLKKVNISWQELSTSQKPSSPSISWISKYSSVTFNPVGREFPDGGFNEVGLYIQEMTLQGTKYPENDKRPAMFMMQWMQYQLDNYETVDQVLQNLDNIILDGWSWHFFVSDISGVSAVIEFINGKALVYTGEEMPFPVLCNSQYPNEITKLKKYNGFGGDQDVNLDDKSIPRFVHAAYLIKNYSETTPQSSIAYGFKILESMERDGTQWSYVIDVKKKQIYFRTSVCTEIKTFNFGSFDLSCDEPTMIIDINSTLQGNVEQNFQIYSEEINVQFITQVCKAFGFDANMIQNLIQIVSAYLQGVKCQTTHINDQNNYDMTDRYALLDNFYVCPIR